MAFSTSARSARSQCSSTTYPSSTCSTSSWLLFALASACYLQQCQAFASKNALDARQTELHSVQLQKQYVPVQKNGKTIAYKTSYFGEIQVGGPEAQSFAVVFDTGSGNLILPAGACRSTACNMHKRYSREASHSSVDIDHDGKPLANPEGERDQVSIAFGTGEVLGEFVQDRVSVGGAEVKLRVVLATEMSDEPFGLFAFDGVLGLGLNALTLDPHFSFFGQLVEQHPDMTPQFAVFLAKREGGLSQISFGGYDPERAESDVRWAPVAMPELGYWQVRVNHIRIGDRVVEECEDGSCRAILDTGTSLLGVPRVATRSMHRMLARPVPTEVGAAPGEVDCRSLPGQTIHFDLGDAVVSLLPEDYSRPTPFNVSTPTSENPDAWMLFCRSLLLPVDMPAPVGPKVFIWGEPVLRRYYTVYDFAEKQIGFAPARDPPEAEMGLPAVGVPPAGSTLSGAPLPSLRGASSNTEVRGQTQTQGLAAPASGIVV